MFSFLPLFTATTTVCLARTLLPAKTRVDGHSSLETPLMSCKRGSGQPFNENWTEFGTLVLSLA